MIPSWFWVSVSILAIAMQLALLYQMYVRGFCRTFVFLTVYLSILFITGVVDLTFFVDAGNWGNTDLGSAVYWADDTLRQVALLLVVVSMIYRTSAHSRSAAAQRRIFAIALAVVALASFLFYHQHQVTRWLTPIMRNLSFMAVIFNLIVWMGVARGTLDRSVALISAGIGLQMAGEAVGQSLRVISLSQYHGSFFIINTANLFLSLSHLLCLYVWMRALRIRVNGPPRLDKAPVDHIVSTSV